VQTAKELAEVWRTVHRNDVFPIRPRTMIAGFASHRDHLVPDKPLRKLISRHLELKRLEHAAVPVHLVTSTAAPATTPAPSPTTSTAGGIPQGPGAGDQDADNNGGPSDGDGNI